MAEQTPAEKLLAEIEAKYGRAPSTQPVAAPSPAPAPAPAPPPEKKGLLGSAMDLFGNRKKQIDQAAGYACGGKIKAHAQGGKIVGPGTSTSDSIPAQVAQTGEPILVSNNERIVSAKQDAILQRIAEMLGFESVDQMFAQLTGEPVGPTMKDGVPALAGGGKYVNGVWVPDDNNQSSTGTIGGEPFVRAPAAEPPSYVAPLNGQPEPIVPAAPPNAGRGVIETPLDRMVAAAGNSVKNSFDNFAAGRPQGSPAPATTTPAPAAGASTAQSPLLGDKRFDLTSSVRNMSIPGQGFMTGAEPGKAPVPVVTPGRNDKGVITAESAANAYGNDMKRSGGIFGTMDLAGQNDRMAKSLGYAGVDDFNKQFANRPAGGVSVLEDPSKAWDEQWQARKLNPEQYVKYLALKQGQSDEMLKNSLNNETVRRGQDLHLQGDLARGAKDPLDQRIKGMQIADAETLSALRGKYLDRNSTPEEKMAALAQLNALGGKNQNENFKIATVRKPDPNNPGQYIEEAYVVNGQGGQNERRVGGQQLPQAPQSAIDFLKKNPDQAAAFKQKYGYLPS